MMTGVETAMEESHTFYDEIVEEISAMRTLIPLEACLYILKGGDVDKRCSRMMQLADSRFLSVPCFFGTLLCWWMYT